MAQPNEEFSRGEFLYHQDNNGNGIPDRFEAGYDPQTGLPANDTYGPQTFGPDHFPDGPYSKVEQRHPIADMVATYPTAGGMDAAERDVMGNAYNEQKKIEQDAGIKTDSSRQENKPLDIGEHERRGVAKIYNDRREIPKPKSLRRSLAESPKTHDKHEDGRALFKDAYEGLLAGFAAGLAKKKERLAKLARATVEQAQIDDLRRQDAELAINAGMNQRNGEAEGRVRENGPDGEEPKSEDKDINLSSAPKEEAVVSPDTVGEQRQRAESAAESEYAERDQSPAPSPSAEAVVEPTSEIDKPVEAPIERVEESKAPTTNDNDPAAIKKTDEVRTADVQREPIEAKSEQVEQSPASSVKTPARETAAEIPDAPKADKEPASFEAKPSVSRAEANASSALGMAANTVAPGVGPAVTAAGLKKAQDSAGTAYEIAPNAKAPAQPSQAGERFKVGHGLGTEVTYSRPQRKLGPNGLEGSVSTQGAERAMRIRDAASNPAAPPRPGSKGPSGTPAFGSARPALPSGFGMKLAKAIVKTVDKARPPIEHTIQRDKSSMER